MLKTNITNCFGIEMKKLLTVYDWQEINEIRIKTDKPLDFKKRSKRIFLRYKRPAEQKHRKIVQTEKERY